MADELDGAEIFDNWEQLVRSPESEARISPEELDFTALVGGQEKDLEYWENLFQESNFGGMNLMGLTYYPMTINEADFFKKYTAAKKDFIQDILANNLNDLRSAGISTGGGLCG